MGTTNHHRTWCDNPRLVNENRNNFSPRVDDDLDDGGGQIDVGMYIFCSNAMVKNTLFSDSLSPSSCCSGSSTVPSSNSWHLRQKSVTLNIGHCGRLLLVEERIMDNR
ncbi:hypothetical protein TNCV_1414451 [Trichonephila clavipes]|nr:hypothetical protein TNCV_1414451 [Trichonephila clavipes]